MNYEAPTYEPLMVGLWETLRKTSEEGNLPMATQGLVLLKTFAEGLVRKKDRLLQRVQHFQLALNDMALVVLESFIKIAGPSSGD